MKKNGLNLKKSQFKEVDKGDEIKEKYKAILEDDTGFQVVLKSEEPIELPEGTLKVKVEEGSPGKKQRLLKKLREEVA